MKEAVRNTGFRRRAVLQRTVSTLFLAAYIASISSGDSIRSPTGTPPLVSETFYAPAGQFESIDYVEEKPMGRAMVFEQWQMVNVPRFIDGFLITDEGWTGIGSVYSEIGCVGCNPGLIMANQERFRDEGMTFAAWRGELNSWWLVTNLENGLQAIARLTDRGRFDEEANPEPHKIVSDRLRKRTYDLSLGLSARLGYITSDRTPVQFNELRSDW